jgi:Zn-dependent M28 family amino/carboxypeptidase
MVADRWMDSFYNRRMPLRYPAIQWTLLLSLVASASLHMGAVTSVEERHVDQQRSARSPGTKSAPSTLDAEAMLATIRTLASSVYEGRRTGTPGGVRARDWIARRFKEIGLAPIGPTYVLPFSFRHSSIKGLVDPSRAAQTEYPDAANVVGLCKATTSGADVVVVSAHYDHLGIRDGTLYPGADDNASGVAVMLAVAEQCRRQPLTHDALFVAFDAEELGLQGAKHFVANPPVPRERLALDINLDMVSRGDKGELFAAGPYHWPASRVPLEQVAKRSKLRLLFGHDKPPALASGVDDWTNQSDHGAFHAAGIPFVYFGVEDHADYHKPTDTPEKIDVTFLRHAADTILDAVITLDRSLPVRH